MLVTQGTVPCVDKSKSGDGSLIDIIKKISKCETTAEFQDLEPKQRDKFLKKLKEKGLSIRQISRLTGINSPRRAGGSNAIDNLVPLAPWDHAAIDPFRHFNP